MTARVVVAVPTLMADEVLGECLASLASQTFRDFLVVVIDNSGRGLARRFAEGWSFPIIFLENARNIGFGAAINQAAAATTGEYVATLNDDCIADPEWLRALVDAMDPEYEIGLCAAQVRLAKRGGDQELELDSAGMLMARDGTSKQRGHRESPPAFQTNAEILMPSGSAAMYRRDMLQDIGGFDESFFLYCEDTDLGLRARWAGWQAYYAAGAVTYHRYSHSSGASSELKAYWVERNRIRTVIKNFPRRELLAVPFAEAARYVFQLAAMFRGKGAAAAFRKEGQSGWRFPAIVWKAHWDAVRNARFLWKSRRQVKRRLQAKQISGMLRRHRISLRRLASL